MESIKQISELKINRRECSKCGAVWLNDQHIWTGTGKPGNDLDLAGLVCNKLGDHQCINPSKGLEGGITWEERLVKLNEDGPQNE